MTTSIWHSCRTLVVSVCVTIFVTTGAFAIGPEELLSDPHLESRARSISAELRCMVCQNQSIDDSNAPLARDLRLLVREQLKAGKSDDEIRSFLVARYGAFVLLKPPFDMTTFLLWFSPLFVFILGGGVLLYRIKRRPKQMVAPLSTDEERRIRELAKKHSV